MHLHVSRSPIALISAIALSAALGCGDNLDDIQPLKRGCQPLFEGRDCFLPFPSDYFLVEDERTATGRRLSIEGAAEVLTVSGVNADPNLGRLVDGFSTISTIVTTLPGELSSAGLVGLLDDPAASVDPSSSTVIVEADTGRLVPHYVDIDPDPDIPGDRAIVIHPIAPLQPTTRYVVALRGLVTEDGELAEAASGFAKLRDGNLNREELEPLVPHYEDAVFPVLEDAGIDRHDLQLAWDFTTGTRENVVSDMVTVRDLTLAWLEDNQPTYVIDEVLEGDRVRGNTERILRGTMTAPRFVDRDEPGAVLSRDGLGQVIQSGSTTLEFTVVVPKGVTGGDEPAKLLAYGHGFFGRQLEVESESAVAIAQGAGAVLFATNWVGMSTPDTTAVINALSSRPAEGIRFAERAHQAMANWLVLTRAMKTILTDDPLLQDDLAEPIYDATGVDFLGISQGHILGGVMAAVNPMIERAVFHAGGSGFTHMMWRSANFSPFLVVLQNVLRSRLDQHKFVALTQSQLDTIDPSIYAPMLTIDPLPGAEPVPTLLQGAIADSSVPNLGTYLHARALGVPLMTPTPTEVFGLEVTEPGSEASALAMYDFGLSPSKVYGEMRPPSRNPVHDDLRRRPEVIEQIARFLDDGVVMHPCSGPCVFSLE